MVCLLPIQAAIKLYHRPVCLHSKHFSYFWRLGGPRSGHWQIPCRVRALFLVQRLTVFLLCPHKVEAARELWEISPVRARIPSTRAPPLSPNPLLKVPLANAVAQGVTISTYEWRGEGRTICNKVKSADTQENALVFKAAENLAALHSP